MPPHSSTNFEHKCIIKTNLKVMVFIPEMINQKKSMWNM